MNLLKLNKREHLFRRRKKCPDLEPNIKEDSIFLVDGEPIGFYLRVMPDRMITLASIANAQFNSDNVPKTMMSRGPQGTALAKKLRKQRGDDIEQLSCILGSVPRKPHMRRNYHTISSVHSNPTAKKFVKSMLMLVKEGEGLIKKYMPKQYIFQRETMEQVPKRWRFGSLFTSSISNYNISAPYHIDTANLKGCVNIIITKRMNAVGGNLDIPDFGATVDQCDNSILVYPAWRNLHGVTPIRATHQNGYRNTFIFYPLRGFEDAGDG